MNKKIKNLFLAGAVIFSLAGVAVSCTDYDDDIDKLQDKTTTLETQVKDLTTKLTQAQTDITSLQSSMTTLQETVKKLQAEGATHATKTELGNAVKDLEAKIAAAEKNANTYTDNAVANALKEAKAYADQLKAAVDKALEGKVDVTTFNETVKRIDDAAAALEERVKAAEEGLVKVNEELDSLKKVTAANGENIEKNKEAIEALDKKLDAAIALLLGKLKGIDFDSQAYVDGVPAIVVKSMDASYVKTSGEKGEEKVAADGDATLNADITASYFLNPSNATVTKDFKFEYIMGDVPFFSTRSQSSNLSITPKFNNVKDGKLTLDLTVSGTPAAADSITKIRLKVTEGSDTSIVSNEHTIYRNVFDNVLVANKKANKDITYTGVEDRHYRNNFYGDLTVSLKEADDNAYSPVSANAIWNEKYDLENNIDTVLTHGETLNLNGILAAHALKDRENRDLELSAEDMKIFHLTWKVELVDYSFKDPATATAAEQNQAEYVKIVDDSLLVVNKDKHFNSGIGRTPIIRASLLDANKKAVAIGYIKVGIKSGFSMIDITPMLDTASKATNTFLFDCSKDSTWVMTDADQITNEIAKKNGYASTEAFLKDYPQLVDKGEATQGKVELVEVDGKLRLKWTIPMDYAWKKAGNATHRNVEFQNTDGKLVVPVALSAHIEEVAKTTNIPTTGDDAKAHYIDNFWFGPDRDNTEGFDLTKFNVNVPDQTFDSTKCLFESSLNVPFKTDAEGNLVLDLPQEYTVKYFFSKEVEKINDVVLDGKQVKFRRAANDTTKLEASVDGTTWAVISTIENGAAAPKLNVISLDKTNGLAKKLLNTDALYTYISATAYYCGKYKYPVKVTFDGKDYYRGDFIRPIYITTNATGQFTDGVNLGQAGSYLDALKLINPYDWRSYSFAEYPDLWNYYGPIKISVDPKEIKCNLGGTNVAVPTNIELKWETQNPWNGVVNEHGMLTYFNNGSPVTDFELYVPVTVKYGWGELKSAIITVPVKGTVGK